jgi:hypothetical protein
MVINLGCYKYEEWLCQLNIYLLEDDFVSWMWSSVVSQYVRLEVSQSSSQSVYSSQPIVGFVRIVLSMCQSLSVSILSCEFRLYTPGPVS